MTITKTKESIKTSAKTKESIKKKFSPRSFSMTDKQYEALEAMAEGLCMSTSQLVRNMLFPDQRITILGDKDIKST